MYVITGANGQTGSAALRYLLKNGCEVKAVVRKPEQAARWIAAGAEVVIADLLDTGALTKAFGGARGAYLMNPPAYAEPDIFAHAARVHTSLIAATEAAGFDHVVALSSVGAQHAEGTGNIKTTHDLESRLARSTLRVTVLRAANFMENWAWSLQRLRSDCILPSMLKPVSRKVPMVSVADIGKIAADQLLLGAGAPPLIELHGPDDYSPDDAAAVLSEFIGRTAKAVAVPEEEWNRIFEHGGFSPSAAAAFCEMYHGFNSGHVAFEGSGVTLRGETSLSTALAQFAPRTAS